MNNTEYNTSDQKRHKYLTIEAYYELLWSNPDETFIDLPVFHSDIIYTMYDINRKFNKDYNPIEVYRMMREEGLISDEDHKLGKYVIHLTEEDIRGKKKRGR